MSIERELLKRVRDTLLELKGTYYGLYWDIQTVLAEPEQKPCSLIVHDDMYKRGYAQAELDLKRKHLTGIEISQGFQTDDDATHPYSYWSGVDFAEKAHGIGGGE